MGNPHLTHQELGLIDKVVWLLHQPCKTLPSPPCCSGGWKFLMKVSIHKPEAVSVGTLGPGSDTDVQKHCRARSWGQNQWIESKLYYLWVMIPSQCVRNVVLCVWKREIYFKTWLMSLGVLCVQRCGAGKQAGDSGKDWCYRQSPKVVWTLVWLAWVSSFWDLGKSWV